MVFKKKKLKSVQNRGKKTDAIYRKFPCLRSLAAGCINKSTIERIHFLKIYIIYLYVFVLPLTTNCIFFFHL